MALESARQTYCLDCAVARRKAADFRADQKRRQADRDRRKQPAAAMPDGSVTLPPDAVRALASRLAALWAMTDAWRRADALHDELVDLEGVGVHGEESALNVHSRMLDLSQDVTEATTAFIAAVGNLLPPEVLPPELLLD